MPLVQDRSLDLSTSSPARYHCISIALQVQNHGLKSRLFHNINDHSNLYPSIAYVSQPDDIAGHYLFPNSQSTRAATTAAESGQNNLSELQTS